MIPYLQLRRDGPIHTLNTTQPPLAFPLDFGLHRLVDTPHAQSATLI